MRGLREVVRKLVAFEGTGNMLVRVLGTVPLAGNRVCVGSRQQGFFGRIRRILGTAGAGDASGVGGGGAGGLHIHLSAGNSDSVCV